MPYTVANLLALWELIGILLCGITVGILALTHASAEGKRGASVFCRTAVCMAVASGVIILLFQCEMTPVHSRQPIIPAMWKMLGSFYCWTNCLIPLAFAWLIAFMMGLCSCLILRFRRQRTGRKIQTKSRLYAMIVLSLLLISALGNHFGLWLPKWVISQYEHAPVMRREDHPEVYLLNEIKDRVDLRIFDSARTLRQEVPLYSETSIKSEQTGVLPAGQKHEMAHLFPTTRRGWRYDQESGCFVRTADMLKAVAYNPNIIVYSLFEKQNRIDVSMLFEYDLYGITPEVYESGRLRGHLFVSPDLRYVMPTLDIFVVLVSLLLLAADAWHSRRKKRRRLSRDVQPGKEGENQPYRF